MAGGPKEGTFPETKILTASRYGDGKTVHLALAEEFQMNFWRDVIELVSHRRPAINEVRLQAYTGCGICPLNPLRGKGRIIYDGDRPLVARCDGFRSHNYSVATLTIEPADDRKIGDLPDLGNEAIPSGTDPLKLYQTNIGEREDYPYRR